MFDPRKNYVRPGRKSRLMILADLLENEDLQIEETEEPPLHGSDLDWTSVLPLSRA